MSASIIFLVRKCRTRTRSYGKGWLSVFGVEGSLQNELITLVTSRYLRAVVLLINWVLYLWNTHETDYWHNRSRFAWVKTSKERSRWWRSVHETGAIIIQFQVRSLHFCCFTSGEIPSTVLTYHNNIQCVLQHLVIIIPGIYLKSHKILSYQTWLLVVTVICFIVLVYYGQVLAVWGDKLETVCVTEPNCNFLCNYRGCEDEC